MFFLFIIQYIDCLRNSFIIFIYIKKFICIKKVAPPPAAGGTGAVADSPLYRFLYVRVQTGVTYVSFYVSSFYTCRPVRASGNVAPLHIRARKSYSLQI